MSEDFIEKTSPSGYVVRVNLKRGTFIVVGPEGQPLSVNRSGRESQIHSLTHVVFLGDHFEFPDTAIDRVGFYRVDRSYMIIPFQEADTSDVRHAYVPMPLYNVDMLPAFVARFKGHWPGPLPPVGEGERYFIAEDSIERKDIVRIKGKFPFSRVIVFRPEEAAPIRIEELENGQGSQKALRAADYSAANNVVQFAGNPVFAARVFLRKLDWNRMYALPLYGKIRYEDMRLIISFVQTMITKAQSSPELSSHQSDLLDLAMFYQGLDIIYRFEMSAVREWKERNGEKSPELIKKVFRSVEAQAGFFEKEGADKEAEFFRNTLYILESTGEPEEEENREMELY